MANPYRPRLYAERSRWDNSMSKKWHDTDLDCWRCCVLRSQESVKRRACSKTFSDARPASSASVIIASLCLSHPLHPIQCQFLLILTGTTTIAAHPDLHRCFILCIVRASSSFVKTEIVWAFKHCIYRRILYMIRTEISRTGVESHLDILQASSFAQKRGRLSESIFFEGQWSGFPTCLARNACLMKCP